MNNDSAALRLREYARKADKRMMPVPGRFVSGDEVSLSLHEARSAQVLASFDGGWPEAERRQVCFHPSDEEPLFTVEWLEIRWNARFSHVEHSDLLGSLMALGMDRGYFGDLVLQGDKAYLACLPEIAVRLPDEWTQAGRTPITVCRLDEAPHLEPPQGESVRDTVSSLRLDCIVQAGMKTSRAKAADVIREGLVQVDHVPEERTDRQLKEGAVVSIRHFGRIRLVSVGEPTRKDRLPVELRVFTRA